MHPPEQLVGEERHVFGIVAGSKKSGSGRANSFQILSQLLHHVLGGLVGIVEGVVGGGLDEFLAVFFDQFG